MYGISELEQKFSFYLSHSFRSWTIYQTLALINLILVGECVVDPKDVVGHQGTFPALTIASFKPHICWLKGF